MADVVAGFLFRDGKVLLGLRKATGKRGGLWECPGGKVDPGESHGAALCREWREELGVDIIDVDPVRIAVAALDLEVAFTVTLYAVKAVRGELRALDHTELRWADPQYAIEYMPCSPAMYLHWPAVRMWLRMQSYVAPPPPAPSYVPGKAVHTFTMQRLGCQHELTRESERCRHGLFMGTTCHPCLSECAKCWDDCATASTYGPRPTFAVASREGVDMAAPYTEPKTTDYCVRCGESPESGSHLPSGHLYVDPRYNGIIMVETKPFVPVHCSVPGCGEIGLCDACRAAGAK